MADKKRTPKNQLDRNSRNAGRILVLAMLLVLIVLGGRFSYVAITQQVRGHDLGKVTQKIYQNQNIDRARRGTIFDVDGNVIAENSTAYTVIGVIDERQIGLDGSKQYIAPEDDKEVAKKMAKILGDKPKYYENILTDGRKNKLSQVQFGVRGQSLNASKYKALKKLDIPGIDFSNNLVRFYPNGFYASDLIGMAQKKEDDKTGISQLKGTMGIEANWDKDLSGNDGIKTTNMPKNEEAKLRNAAAESGHDIYTTLNSNLQKLLEGQMDKLAKETVPYSATATVMDTQTGKIVAQTQRPSYNPETGKGIGDLWSNELVEAPYEPGSVMKGIMVAAAIENGTWKPNDTFASGRLRIGDKVVNDWNEGQGWGRITYSEGLARSSNVAMAKTVEKMGADVWRDYIDKFDFLKSTNSGLTTEEAGSIQYKYPIDQASTAFGQAIAVTPIQMLQAYSAIAGNGEVLKPQFIEKIVNSEKDEVLFQAKRQVVSHPISEKTAKATRKQLEDVIYSPAGTGKEYAIPGVRTSGKSGTAQISTANGYSMPGDTSNEIHSWMGMAPADKPRYVMYIVVKKPTKNGGNINKYLADVFVPVMQRALTMSEDDNKIIVSKDQEFKVPNVTGLGTNEAKKVLEKSGLQSVVIGDGPTVKQQNPPVGRKTLANQLVVLQTDSNSVTMPDMRGWSKSDALAWGKLANLEIRTKGEGFVTSQSIDVGTELDDSVKGIAIELKMPKGN